MSPLSGNLQSECNVFSLAVASLLNSDSLLTLIIIKAVNNYTNRGHRTAQLEPPEGCRLCVAERCGQGCCLYFTACQLRRCSCRCRNQRAQRSATQTQSQSQTPSWSRRPCLRVQRRLRAEGSSCTRAKTLVSLRTCFGRAQILQAVRLHIASAVSVSRGCAPLRCRLMPAVSRVHWPENPRALL